MLPNRRRSRLLLLRPSPPKQLSKASILPADIIRNISARAKLPQGKECNHAARIYKRHYQGKSVFVQLLGVCPALATTSSLTNALGMGAAFTAVLIGSNLIISALKKFIPANIRIPAYIVVIASLVT